MHHMFSSGREVPRPETSVQELRSGSSHNNARSLESSINITNERR